jgi:(E)-4-hydroxy-3-methylbut-2-enyl-diphosphate synthase
MERKITKAVKVGKLYVGGENPIVLQSMTNTDTRDFKSTINQIKALEEAGCQLIRCAVPDMQAAEAIKEIKKGIAIPLVADIHFDYKLALKSIENGVDALRINPGNIGSEDRVREVVKAAQAFDIPIRIGVNSGSVEKKLLEKYGRPSPEALVESAMGHVHILEKLNFNNIVISIKSSNVVENIEGYRILSGRCDYPLHLGVTEAGTAYSGTIKSAVGIGTLLCEGIGDTIRVSLTDSPIEEIKAGLEILKACGCIREGVEFVSCPTCGRTSINLIELAKKAEEALKSVKKPIKVAVMGCAVNGPGEAREADIGIAGGKGEGLIFKKGKIIKKVPEDKLLEELLREIEEL